MKIKAAAKWLANFPELEIEHFISHISGIVEIITGIHSSLLAN
jgi:hypothetical protein